MKQSILEVAVLVDNWRQILDVWPEVNVKECSFPFKVHYIDEELNDQYQIYFYLFELENASHFEPMEKLIPYLPFSLMFVDELDETFEKKISIYTNRFDTPLFLVLIDDEKLKEKISTIAHLDFKLPEFVVMEKQATVTKTVRSLIKTILERVRIKASADKNPEIESPADA